ncbi:MAG: hypothetical protein ACI82F_004252 [Planctomycetota bacterium]
MRKALESLPWAGKATVDYLEKQATVSVVTKDYDERALFKALKDAGFGGSVKATDNAQRDYDEQPPAKPIEGAVVAFQVSGMKKTKSGAT